MQKIENIDSNLKHTPGSIVLCNFILKGVFKLLQNETFTDYNLRNWSFSCLMQLLESIVIHERVFFWIPLRSKEGPTLDNSFYTSHEGWNEALKSRVFKEELKKISPFLNFLILPYKSETNAMVSTTNLVNFPFADPTILDEKVINPETYLTLSSIFGLAYKPAPWDAKATEIIIEKTRDKYYSSFAAKTLNTISQISAIETREVNEWLSEERFKIEIPLVFSYILDQHQQHRETVIDTSLRVRDMKETVAFRKVCAEFDEAARIGDSNGINRIIREVSKEAENLSNRFQAPMFNLSLQVPPAIAFNPLEVWKEFSNKRKRHLIFIGNLYKAAVQSEGLQKAFYKTRLSI